VDHLISTELPRPGGAYSHLTVAGGLVFTAGLSPHDPAGGPLPEGIEAQTEATIRNLERVLAEVGLDLSHVVKSTVHLAELERDFATFNEVYGRLFPRPYPVRTTVGSRLLDILVEIDVVAALPER
jgi:reactive intermediate/imine deaminase